MIKNLDYYYKNALSINDFLEKYYGRTEFRNKKLVHENVKSLFPDIQRGSFEDIVKNPELVYTGKVVLVRDSNNKCIPYITGYELENNGLDERENLIVQLVSAIDKIMHNYNNGLIILENNDSISNDIIGSTSREIDIIDEEFVKLNQDGGILIKNLDDIYTFERLMIQYLNLTSINQNKEKANLLTQEKDIIAINITNQGRVYITFNGITYEQENLLDIRNFLLKSYYPKKEELVSETSDIDLSFLMDYELETLLKKYYKEKNISMFFKIKKNSC